MTGRQDVEKVTVQQVMDACERADRLIGAAWALSWLGMLGYIALHACGVLP